MADLKISLGMFGAQDVFGGDPLSLVEIAKAADQVGVDQIVFTDHVVMSDRTDRYPFGSFPVPPDFPWYEPMTLMSVVAGATQQIRVATGVLISPLRPAALLAKMAATLDQLSNGRLDLGIGTGWQSEEYEAIGLDYSKRWQLFDDQLETLQTLWREAPAQVDTPSVKIDGLYCKPFPRQAGGVPLWFGVSPTPKNSQRMARYGTGWVPIQNKPDFIREGVEQIQQAYEQCGRDTSELKVRAHARIKYRANGKADLQESIDSVAAIHEAGATHIEFELAPFINSEEDLNPFLQRIVALKD